MTARLPIRWTPGPVALLWDMDNVSTGRDQVADLAKLLGALGGPDVRRIAAGHFVTCRAHGSTAAESGFEVLNGGRRPQGADRLLLQRASRQAKRGTRYFWVASNDGVFAQVAHMGPLTVLTLDETRVSARLRAAANAVISMRSSGDEWRVHYASGVRFEVAEGGPDVELEAVSQGAAPPRAFQMISPPRTGGRKAGQASPVGQGRPRAVP